MWELLVCLALAADPPGAPLAADLPGAPIDATVLIEVGADVCAGSIIDAKGTIATAYHCVASGGRPGIETRDERTHGRTIAVSVRDDLALISAPDLAGSPWIPIRDDLPAVGDKVRAIGHPYGASIAGGFLSGLLRWSTSEGIVANLGDRAIQTTAPVNPGNSGGPLVDVDGRLVGVISRRIGGDGLGFAARADALSALIEDPHRPSPIGGTLGAELVAPIWLGDDGILALGGQVELAFRDRVLVDGTLAFAPSARWEAVTLGHVSWEGAEVRLGLRQRLFAGPLAMRVDGYGGIARLDHLAGDATLHTTASATAIPVFGGVFSCAGFALDVGAGVEDGALTPRLILAFRWPGVVRVF